MDNFRDSYFSVQWDISKKRLSGTFWGKQYDTGRGFAVTVINGGQVVTPTNEVLRLKWEKPDNTSGYVQATVVNGKFIIENIDQMFTVAGSVRADFDLSVLDETVSSITFYANVEKAVAVGAIESSSEFTALQDALAAVGTISYLKDGLNALDSEVSDLETQFNNVVANVTVDSEVIAARGTDATLGVRLDNIDARWVPSKNLFDKSAVTVDRFIQDDGTLTFSGAYNVSDFIPVVAGQNYALNQLAFGKVICYNASKTWIAAISRAGVIVTPPANTAFVRFTVTDGEMDTTQFEVGSESTSYATFGPKLPYAGTVGFPEVDAQPIRKTVGASGADYTTINAALNSITDASEQKPYEIFIFRGTYNETFRTKHWVDIIGEDKYKTIVDFTGTLATWDATSTVFAETQGTIRNMTLIATDTKYPLHIDKATGKWTLTIDNVRCIHKGSLTDPAKAGTPVGIGLYQGQHLIIRNCEMINLDSAYGSSGVYFHNQADSAGDGYRSIRIEECKITGTTYGIRPNDVVSGGSTVQNNDAYIINNDITASHQEYYYPENSPSWNLFKKGNEYTQG